MIHDYLNVKIISNKLVLVSRTRGHLTAITVTSQGTHFSEGWELTAVLVAAMSHSLAALLVY